MVAISFCSESDPDLLAPAYSHNRNPTEEADGQIERPEPGPDFAVTATSQNSDALTTGVAAKSNVPGQDPNLAALAIGPDLPGGVTRQWLPLQYASPGRDANYLSPALDSAKAESHSRHFALPSMRRRSSGGWRGEV